MLVIISGVSGVGKNTVISEIMNRRDNVKFFNSGTTRERRPFEKDGEPYIFMSKDEFLKRQKNEEFFETQEVHGNFYGILYKSLEEAIKNEKIFYVRDIDVYGNVRLKNYMNGKGRCLSIFLDAPDEVIKSRLIGRGESEERANVRMSRAQMEREHLHEYDYVIENIDLEKTVSKVLDIFDEAKNQ